MLAVVRSDVNSGAGSEVDYAAAAQRFARSAVNPLLDRASSQELLDSVSRLADATDPANMGGFKLFTTSNAGRQQSGIDKSREPIASPGFGRLGLCVEVLAAPGGRGYSLVTGECSA